MNIIHEHHHPITLHSGLGLGSALVPPSNNERLDRWDSKWSNANINVQGHMELNMIDMILYFLIWKQLDMTWYFLITMWLQGHRAEGYETIQLQHPSPICPNAFWHSCRIEIDLLPVMFQGARSRNDTPLEDLDQLGLGLDTEST